jgi:hypothetical protein
VTQTNPKGNVRHKRLRLLHIGGSPRGGVSDVAETHVANEVDHVLELEDVADEAIVLV